MSEREIEAGIAIGSPEFFELPKDEQKARMARVLARASTIDTLHIAGLPEHLWGEWVPKDAVSVLHHQMLGFKVDDTYAHKTSIDGTNVHGDCVFMVQPIELHNLIESQRQETYNRIHGIKSETPAREEIEFKSTAADELPALPIRASQKSIEGEEIKAALGGT